MITLVDEYFFLKSSGIVLSIAVLEGQILICPNFRHIKLSQVIKTRLTVDTETFKYQTSFFESLIPEQNRNKPNYIEKKNQNVKTESTLKKATSQGNLTSAGFRKNMLQLRPRCQE